MKARVSTLLAACAAVLLAVVSANAQPRITPPGGGGGGGGGQPQSAPGGLIQGTTLEMTMEALKQAGFTDVKTYEARSGNRHVAGNVGQTLVSIIHQGCKEGVCPIIMFMVFFGKQETVDANYMNAWNREKLYTKLYTDEEGQVFFRMDSFLVDVPPQYITRQGQLFAMMLKHVYEYKPGQQN